MMASNLSRRGALGALAAFTAAPAIALPAPADTADILWAERQKHVERIALFCAEYDAADAKLPAWARSGPERIDANGNFCGHIVAWPLVEDLTPPSVGKRIVRPSIYQAKENFDFAVRVFGSTPAFRARCRAAMRRNIKAITARLRTRHQLHVELGLDRIDREMSDTCHRNVRSGGRNWRVNSPMSSPQCYLRWSATTVAVQTLRKATVTVGPWRWPWFPCGGCLPGLSGLTREHAALLVENPTLPLSEMPFAPVRSNAMPSHRVLGAVTAAQLLAFTACLSWWVICIGHNRHSAIRGRLS
jgi:hypothetical protein